MPFDIKTEVFEGPLDLLVSLIEKREVFINDINLSSVTDTYIEHINSLDEKDISNMSDFVLVASTLVLIKSKSLLPTLDLSGEEEESIVDLENRVKKYQLIKSLTDQIQNISSHGSSYARGDIKKQKVSFAPSRDMGLESLLAAGEYLIANLPKPEAKNPTITVERVVSLDEVIEDLRQRIQSNFKMSFREYSGGDKVNVIIGFLALLELVKQGALKADQGDDFTEITIESDSLSTPNYS